MNKVRLAICGWLLAVAALAGAEPILIENARVVTLAAAGTIARGAILIDDGRIVAVGESVPNRDGVQRVDAGGGWVTPGFLASATQLGLVEIGAEASSVDAAVREFALGPAFDVRFALNPDSVLLPYARAAGVTRAVVAPRASNDPLAGWGASIQLGGDDLLTDSRTALFGAIDVDAAEFTGGSRAALLTRLRLSLARAKRFSASRYAPDEHDYSAQDMAALKRFLGSGAPLALEVHRSSQILQALALASEFRFPLIVVGGTEAWKVAPQLAAADVPVVLDPLDNIPVDFDRLGARLDNAALLSAAGVRIAFLSENSHNPNWLRQGAGVAVANGLPFDVALAAISRTAFEIWGLEGGRLAAGAVADLVLWSGDPLELTTHVERVMINGEWVDVETRQERLRRRYADLDSAAPLSYQ